MHAAKIISGSSYIARFCCEKLITILWVGFKSITSSSSLEATPSYNSHFSFTIEVGNKPVDSSGPKLHAQISFSKNSPPTNQLYSNHLDQLAVIPVVRLFLRTLLLVQKFQPPSLQSVSLHQPHCSTLNTSSDSLAQTENENIHRNSITVTTILFF